MNNTNEMVARVGQVESILDKFVSIYSERDNEVNTKLLDLANAFSIINNNKNELNTNEQNSVIVNNMQMFEKRIVLLEDTINKQDDKIKGLSENYDNITKTFLMNGNIKRKFDKYISSLTYKMTGGKDSIKDRLFHGDITRACKAHIINSLVVTNVNFIKVDDFEDTKKLANCFMKPYAIKEVIKKKMEKLRKKDDSKVGLKTEQKLLYDAYLDETNGGIDI